MYYLLDANTKKIYPGLTEYIEKDPINNGPAPKCNACGKFTGMLTWLPPFRVELEAVKGVLGDIVFGSGNDLLVSEKFTNAWNADHMRGLSGFEPVEVLKVNHQSTEKGEHKYYHVSIATADLAIDQNKSNLKWEPETVCKQCRTGDLLLSWDRIVFEQAEIKENIFYAIGLPGAIFVDDKFRDFYRRNKIINCPLIPAEDYSKVWRY